MNFSVLLSLENLAAIKIATALWNQSDIIKAVKDNTRRTVNDNINQNIPFICEMREKVTSNLSRLVLPEKVKDKIRQFIHPVGKQVIYWPFYHPEFSTYGLEPKRFFWTSNGGTDRKKMLQEFVNYQSIEIHERYKVACIHCMQSEIEKLKQEILERQNKSSDDKEIFYFDEECPCFGDDRVQPVYFQRYDKKIYRLPYTTALKVAITQGNKEAVEYIFPKLTPEEKVIHLKSAFHIISFQLEFRKDFNSIDPPLEYSTNILFFFLKQMTEFEQLQALSNNAEKFLDMLWRWPYQTFLIQNVKHVFELLKQSEFFRLLRSIQRECMDFEFYNFFPLFWSLSPSSYKTYALDRFSNESLITEYYPPKIFISSILNDATIEQKKKVFLCVLKEFCSELMSFVKWAVIKFLLKECFPSKNLIDQFKKEFPCTILRKAHRKHLFRIMDEVANKEEENTWKTRLRNRGLD